MAVWIGAGSWLKRRWARAGKCRWNGWGQCRARQMTRWWNVFNGKHNLSHAWACDIMCDVRTKCLCLYMQCGKVFCSQWTICKRDKAWVQLPAGEHYACASSKPGEIVCRIDQSDHQKTRPKLRDSMENCCKGHHLGQRSNCRCHWSSTPTVSTSWDRKVARKLKTTTWTSEKSCRNHFMFGEVPQVSLCWFRS